MNLEGTLFSQDTCPRSMLQMMLGAASISSTYPRVQRVPCTPQHLDRRASVLPGCVHTLNRRLAAPGAAPTQEGKVLLDKDPVHYSSQGHFPSRVPTRTTGCGPLLAFLSAQSHCSAPSLPGGSK